MGHCCFLPQSNTYLRLLMCEYIKYTKWDWKGVMDFSSPLFFTFCF